MTTISIDGLYISSCYRL